jgi:hypothetical protein
MRLRKILSFLALAGWFVRGTAVWQPPDTLFNFFGQTQGQAPTEKPPKKPPPYATRRALTGGCSFCPFGGRNASAAAGQMRWSFLLAGRLYLI